MTADEARQLASQGNGFDIEIEKIVKTVLNSVRAIAAAGGYRTDYNGHGIHPNIQIRIRQKLESLGYKVSKNWGYGDVYTVRW